MPRTQIAPQDTPDRRVDQRIATQLTGKLFVPAEEVTLDCMVVNLSGGGAGLLCLEPPPLQTFVVLYIEGFGRFEAVTIHFKPGELGLRFVFRNAKRQRLLADIAHFIATGTPHDETRLRRHPRVTAIAHGFFARANGTMVECEILDISLQGMSLKTVCRPPVGEIIRLGVTSGRVVRHHEDGIGVQFLNVVETEAHHGR